MIRAILCLLLLLSVSPSPAFAQFDGWPVSQQNKCVRATNSWLTGHGLTLTVMCSYTPFLTPQCRYVEEGADEWATQKSILIVYWLLDACLSDAFADGVIDKLKGLKSYRSKGRVCELLGPVSAGTAPKHSFNVSLTCSGN